jgi:ubiquinone/menaquinone biosynthesis C-methylase UbiE
MHAYPLQSGSAGAARLDLLARVHEPATEALFARLAVPPAARCLDVGCGVGAVSRLLAATFARDGGVVVGVDVDEHYLEVARANGGSDGADTIRYERAGAHELAWVAEFDLVYARFLLSHLREPREALGKLVRAAKPGGVLAVEDVDFGGAFCDPPSRDFDRYLGWYDAMTRGNGADPNLGRALFRWVTELGLSDVNVVVAQPAFGTGPGKDLAALTLEHIGATLVERNLASTEEVAATLAAMKAYAGHPTTLVSMPRVFQVWGRVT